MFDGFIRDNARWTPRAPALVTPGRAATYAELDAHVDRVGRGLQAMGIGPRSGVVSLALDDPYLHLVTLAALARLGVASSPGHDPAADLRLADARQLAPFLDAPAEPLPQLELDPEATGRVMLTSGAPPRRVAVSWRRMEIANFTALRTFAAGKAGTFVPVTGDGSPLGFGVCVAAWSVGGAVAAGMALADLPGWLEALPPGFVGLAPHHLRRLLDALPPGFRPRPAWRLGVAGAPLPAPLAREALARITSDVRILYGAAECSDLAYGHAADLDAVPGQVGHTPAGAIVEVVGHDGRPVPDGQSGELRVAAERMTDGYLGDAPATAERFRDGWFHTRDVGRRLPNGLLVLEGRADDRLDLGGGATVMPDALEAAAYAYPGVRDCAAFAALHSSAPDSSAPDAGRPDGVAQCWLAVVAAERFDRDGLARHLADQPGLPQPRFAWIDEIPRDATGRIERARLGDMLLSALARRTTQR